MEVKLKFNLKQDSPMIHFQGGTSGATLRASEVKPKLDRFLKEWCRRKEIEIPKEWKPNQEHDAFDYKMRISAGSRVQKDIEKLPSYFGKLDDQRKNILAANGVRLEILCFHNGLREVIKKAMETFFVLHNFGTRQNRGIGGFTLRDTSAAKAEKILADWYKDTASIYKMTFDRKVDPRTILECGNMYYQILKSGINNRGVYIKSYLTLYFLNREVGRVSQPIGGEKRWMKEKNISPAIGKTANEPNNKIKVNDFKYIRGLLGVAGDIRYKTEQGPMERINISSRELERVPSTIWYKIVQNVLFIIPLEPEAAVYDKKFTFRNKDSHAKGSLPTPSKSEFDMQGLMTGFIQYVNDVGIRKQIGAYAHNAGITQPVEPIKICRGGER